MHQSYQSGAQLAAGMCLYKRAHVHTCTVREVRCSGWWLCVHTLGHMRRPLSQIPHAATDVAALAARRPPHPHGGSSANALRGMGSHTASKHTFEKVKRTEIQCAARATAGHCTQLKVVEPVLGSASLADIDEQEAEQSCPMWFVCMKRDKWAVMGASNTVIQRARAHTHTHTQNSRHIPSTHTEQITQTKTHTCHNRQHTPNTHAIIQAQTCWFGMC